MTTAERFRRFRNAYGAHRAREGHGAGGEAELLELPYLRWGPLARQWAVRARTFDRLVRRLRVGVRGGPGRLRLLDLGAGNGWLCYRLAQRGYATCALDVRTDRVDGLGAGEAYRRHLPSMFPRIAASFDAIPFRAGAFDVVVFNASLHYAVDLEAVLADAERVVGSGGRIFILDSPFYRNEASGRQMIREKRRTAPEYFGELAGDLVELPFVEFLTRERLDRASKGLALKWRRHRVRYPLWYSLRPLWAALRGRRAPSRFDLWEAVVPG